MGVVYSITFKGGSRSYVGSSAGSLRYRMRAHLSLLRQGRHHSIQLQRAADKYGLGSMVVSVLEEVGDDSDLIAAEQRWIDARKGQLYNASPTAASRLGATMPREAKAKISASLLGNQRRRGIPHDADVKAKIGAGVAAAYAEGRKKPVSHPQNFAAFNAAVKAGAIPHPSVNPEFSSAVIATHRETRSLKKTGAVHNLSPSGVWYLVKRYAPHQLRKRSKRL